MTTKARLTRTLTQNKFLNDSMQNCKKKKKQKEQNKAGTDENQTQHHKQKMPYGHK